MLHVLCLHAILSFLPLKISLLGLLSGRPALRKWRQGMVRGRSRLRRRSCARRTHPDGRTPRLHEVGGRRTGPPRRDRGRHGTGEGALVRERRCVEGGTGRVQGVRLSPQVRYLPPSVPPRPVSPHLHHVNTTLTPERSPAVFSHAPRRLTTAESAAPKLQPALVNPRMPSPGIEAGR